MEKKEREASAWLTPACLLGTLSCGETLVRAGAGLTASWPRAPITPFGNLNGMVDYSVPASPQVTRERVYKQRGQQEGQGLMGTSEVSKASSAESLGPVSPGFSENVPYLAAEVSAISQISECFRLKDGPFTV